jgi:hypothetical protein
MPGEFQLQELLFGLQNPTNEQLFIERCARLFEPDDSKNWIDVYQPRITQTGPIGGSAPNTASGVGPPRNDANVHRIGDDIEYDQIRSFRT